ncbi:carboxylesterase family protein [Massilia forsythiae]|uniref:Carboxylic ester hydrolase n=1 Tax=Massilia forsythiae TaxID=2728020 RepID=A0A7Z2ZTS6_9BURK|nr:carboxylesterase family protein [Massilia forsythiae]QJE01901.1 carboxylesterase family protein [Massilia forsythiae]
MRHRIPFAVLPITGAHGARGRRPAAAALAAALGLPLLLAGCATAGAGAAAVPAGGAGLQVRLDTGTLEGRAGADGVRAFKGIPYAAAPVGALRWQAPQAAPRWDGVRRADAFGARCMQLPLFADMVFRSNGVSEDCLYLNVWTPAAPAATGEGQGLPVLVYFYGGGLVAGDGSEPRYDGAAMARQGIVAITVNYRLGLFGFLAHPELSAESPHRASGNYGFMDQAAALQWVRRNAAAFGGDPRRVTIAGESAGSYSVSVQMASPLAKDLIAGAIGESGALLGMNALPTLAEAEAAGRQLGNQLGNQLGAPTLAQLRALPAQALLDAGTRPDAVRAGAIVDGYVLPQAPAAIYGAGRQAHVPLLAGWNSAEGGAGSILGDGKGGAAPTEADFMAGLRRLYGARAADARRAYAGDVDSAARELASDRFIGFGTWRWIDLHARSGGQPVYRYYYTQPRPASRAGAPAATGAAHSVEIEYVLGNLDGNPVYAWTPADVALSRQAQAYFANFVKTGNPNGAGLPHWPALDRRGAGSGSALMVLGVPSHAVEAADGAHHAFHESMGPR